MTNGVFNPEPVAEHVDDNQDGSDYKKRYEDSQVFIDQLKRETAEMRERLAQKEVEAEAARLIEEARLKAATTVPPSFEAKPASNEPAKSVDTDDLVERVIEAQRKRQDQDTATKNAQAATEKLVEVFGTEAAANKAVRDRAASLGVGVDFLLSAAQKSPTAFYELMNLGDKAPTAQLAPRGDVNTVALKNHAPGAVKPGTPEYYEQLRKELGDTAFYTPKIQNQRMKDMMAYHGART